MNFRRSAVSALVLACCFCLVRAAELPPVVVVYPEVSAPYRASFEEILNGIAKRTPARRIVINSPGSAADTLRQLAPANIIALGRAGKNEALLADGRAHITCAALVNPDRDCPNATFGLLPDPALLFARLKLLNPNSKRVFVVYSQTQNGWQLPLARAAAASRNLELVALEVTDSKAAVEAFKRIFAGANADSDAIWMLPDSNSSESSAVVPLVLTEAWRRDVMVFSSAMEHVRRGAVFSVLPNFVDYGYAVADAALRGSTRNELITLKQVRYIVNSRAAQHLGLSTADIAAFDVITPQP